MLTVVIRVRIVDSLMGARVRQRRRHGLPRGGEERHGEGGQVVRDHGLDEAAAVGEGEVCQGRDGGAHLGHDLVDLGGRAAVGYLEGREVHTVGGHEPDVCFGGVSC